MPTLIELETEVRNLLDEPQAAQWTQAMIRTWLNEGNRDLARFTRHYKSTDSFATVAGTAEYTMLPNIITIEHAYYNDGSRTIPLQARAFENMDAIWGWDQNRQNRPQFFTTWGYSPNLRMRLYPVPVSSTDTVELLTAVYPTMMPLAGSDNTNVDVPLAWYDALANYCEYMALRRDRDPRAQEAFLIYTSKRQEMVLLGEALTVNREVIPDPHVGYLPRWLTEFE